MRLLWVRAHPFGPIKDQQLSFGPGLTVISGANETGKSSWHAATTTALTGRRKGKARKADEHFAAQSSRYKPWTGDSWAVSCAVETDAGRVVRITHDLVSGVSQAIDDVTGEDLSADLMHDRGLDASTLAGLNRQILPLVASVGQAEILELAVAQGRDASVGVLRNLLQQSVSSRSESDSSAEQAIARLTAQKQAIGTSRKGSSKPMRRAMDAVDAADAAVDHAADQWERHRQREASRAEAESRTSKLSTRIGQLQLAESERRADRLAARLARARDFQVIVDERGEAGELAGGDLERSQLVARVRSALLAMDNVAPIPAVPARSSGDVLAELDTVPVAPKGPTAVSPELVAAREDVRDAEQAQQAIVDQEPAVNPLPAGAAGFSSLEFRQAADQFARRSVLAEQRGLAVADISTSRSSAIWPMLAGVFVGLLAIVGGIAVTQWLAVVLGALVVVGSVVFGWSLHRNGPTSEPDGRRGQSAVEGSPPSALEARVVAAGLPTDPEQLRAHALGIEDHDTAQRSWDLWDQKRQDLAHQGSRAVAMLTAELRKAGADDLGGADLSAADRPPSDVLLAANRWVEACADRQRQFLASEKRTPLTHELQAVRATEAAIEEASRRRDEMIAELHAVVVAAGLSSGTTVQRLRNDADEAQRVRHELQSWCEAADESQQADTRASEAARSLQELLDGRSMAELEDAVATRNAARDELFGEFGPVPESWAARKVAEIKVRREQLERELVTERRTADQLRGAVEEETGHLTSLAELREAQSRAHDEFDRLQSQLATIDTTIDLLVQARREVHRDVAPVLARLTEDRLARVTAGRYKQLRVNPEDLSVQVQQAGGMWMPAEQLSHGTAEQIYLLLRVAIAEVVAPADESCPLLLDDVTVHADDERTAAMLDVVHELSKDRQVVLFSQESGVREWATEVDAMVISLPPV